MYRILINDFENNKQYLSAQTAHYSSAIDMCESLAFDYILSREGERYFNASPSPWRLKSYIKKGYGICRKENSISTKLTVFRKEPNGFIYSGMLKKMIQFQTVKMKPEKPEPRISEMADEWKYAFGPCMDELAITKNKYEPEN